MTVAGVTSAISALVRDVDMTVARLRGTPAINTPYCSPVSLQERAFSLAREQLDLKGGHHPFGDGDTRRTAFARRVELDALCLLPELFGSNQELDLVNLQALGVGLRDMLVEYLREERKFLEDRAGWTPEQRAAAGLPRLSLAKAAAVDPR